MWYPRRPGIHGTAVHPREGKYNELNMHGQDSKPTSSICYKQTVEEPVLVFQCLKLATLFECYAPPPNISIQLVINLTRAIVIHVP